MTETQLALIIGTIYVAPHMNTYVAQAVGCAILIAAALSNLSK